MRSSATRRTASPGAIAHDFLEGDHRSRARRLRQARRGVRSSMARRVRRRADRRHAVDAGDGGRSTRSGVLPRPAERFAIKGVAGWTAPAIGTPNQSRYQIDGRKIKGGAPSSGRSAPGRSNRPGTPICERGPQAGAEVDPPGYCHFHEGCDERYFKQITSEYLGATVVKWPHREGLERDRAEPSARLPDLRLAMAEYLGLTRMTVEEWAVQAAAITIAPAAPPASPVDATAAPAAPWIAPRADWMKRS
jgi:hypothetical protein